MPLSCGDAGVELHAEPVMELLEWFIEWRMPARDAAVVVVDPDPPL